MNETSATSQSGASLLPDGIGALTAVHLAIVALLAIAAIAIIVVGARRKRGRTKAAREMARNAEQAGVAPPGAEPEKVEESEPEPRPVAPPPPAATPEPVVAAPAPLDDEPIAAAAPMDASPASEAAPLAPAPAAAATTDAPGDQPVTLLKGLGPKVSAALSARGITTVGQLAALDDAGAAALDAEMGPFRGRMARDRWIEQARFLAAGDRAGFEAVFGKL